MDPEQLRRGIEKIAVASAKRVLRVSFEIISEEKKVQEATLPYGVGTLRTALFCLSSSYYCTLKS
jgi:hypothetical protein